MKKYFITGLVILLPLTLTLVLVAFLFNFLTEPFLGISRAIFTYSGFLNNGFLFLSAEQLQTLFSQVLILIVLFFFTVLLGLIARWFFFHYIIRFWESLIHRIPFVSVVYKTCQDVIKTIFTTDNNAFKQVVMVQFPNPETRTIGLVTREGFPGAENTLGNDLLVVFVPTTPNPTSGFLTIVKKQDVVNLDMSIEDAFKLVISCGVIMAPFRKGDNLISEKKIKALYEDDKIIPMPEDVN